MDNCFPDVSEKCLLKQQAYDEKKEKRQRHMMGRKKRPKTIEDGNKENQK